VTDNDGAFDSDTLRPEGSFELTFDKVGTFDYYCALHPTMVGRVMMTFSFNRTALLVRGYQSLPRDIACHTMRFKGLWR
jgi:hypothetical protein